MKNFLIISIASLTITFSHLVLAGCGGGNCGGAPMVPTCSTCQTTNYDNGNSWSCNYGPNCQCTDPYCYFGRDCMSLGSCCTAFGNVGGLDEDELRNDS